MARINIYEEFRSDPRFTEMCSLMPRHEAVGAIVCLWELGQAYWRKDRGLIPKEIYWRAAKAKELKMAGFTEEQENGFYCKGAEERWQFLFIAAEKGRMGGLKSAQIRKERYGTTRPLRQDVCEAAASGSREAEREADANPAKLSSSFSFSSSFSSSSSGSKKLRKKEEKPCNEQNSFFPPEEPCVDKSPPPKKSSVWESKAWLIYCEEYLKRWKVSPTKNGKVGKQVKDFIERVGARDAPEILKFYLKHNDSQYLKALHSIGFALMHAEGLRTQWLRGRAITSTDIRAFEQSDRLRSQLERIDRGEI